MVTTNLGLQGYNAPASPHYSSGPYKWDQQLVWNVTDSSADFSLGGNASDELRGVVINHTGTLTSGTGIAGLRVIATTAGSSGAWADGIYGEVSQGTTQNVTGYLAGGEFQTSLAGSFAPSYWGVLVLNSNDNNTSAQVASAYIWLRDYGTKPLQALFWFYDLTVGSASTSVLMSSTSDKTATHMLRFRQGAGGTTYWILCNSAGPS